ncbi:MAG: 5-formyltetrahydrofolate cyclo-ligase [Candidatus Omnitrophica bacterium]|nr:5-formyltetrahydrofolate cyclo-ligase [Candidatus Omnitrophota bacterium]
MRRLIRTIPRSARKAKSKKIIAALQRAMVFKRARNIMTYVALPEEVQTWDLIRQARALDKRVFVPKIEPKSRCMMAVEVIDPAKELKKGTYGILAPKQTRGRILNPRHLDLVIVPGVGFDPRGRRLGRGKGYFDRFLKKATHARKIGLAFREQMVKKIPAGPQDVPMDRVLTD